MRRVGAGGSAAILVLCFCLSAAAQDRVIPLFVGDSLTCGLFPRRVVALLPTDYVTPGDWVSVCRSGARTRVIRQALEKNIAKRFTHVVIQTGINDCHVADVNDDHHVVSDIEHMILEVQQHGAIPVVVFLFPCGRGQSQWCGSCGISIRNYLDRPARMPLDPVFVDASDMAPCGKLDPKFDAGDGIHLNGRGHTELARLIVSAIVNRVLEP